MIPKIRRVCTKAGHSRSLYSTRNRQLHAKTDRQRENFIKIGLVRSGRLDIQLVPISIIPFGLSGYKWEGVDTCVGGWVLRCVIHRRKRRRRGPEIRVIGSRRICAVWNGRELPV
ncbi:hypothetical protein AVEN_214108-1 [Araneus ventricosus]|uniref:Uncharacterized protein n=1 Tax=Araneus ventricosus TaxID=182803 RepID=A0A4Y2C7L6_ARAVE|nr:hypothetical protein AVEN_214108-1 [Araneus ventricosus]